MIRTKIAHLNNIILWKKNLQWWNYTRRCAWKTKKKFKNEIDKFKESTKPKTLVKKEKETWNSEKANSILKGRQNFLHGLKTEYFNKKYTQGKGLDLICIDYYSICQIK